jgi:hypothetical protein
LTSSSQSDLCTSDKRVKKVITRPTVLAWVVYLALNSTSNAQSTPDLLDIGRHQKCRWTPQALARGANPGEAGLHSLPDPRPVELGDRPQDV